MTSCQFRRIALLWLAGTTLSIAVASHAGYRDGYAAAQGEAASARASADAAMSKLGLCEWPRAYAKATHCPGY